MFLFIPLIIVILPTIVGILKFMSRIILKIEKFLLFFSFVYFDAIGWA